MSCCNCVGEEDNKLDCLLMVHSVKDLLCLDSILSKNLSWDGFSFGASAF